MMRSRKTQWIVFSILALILVAALSSKLTLIIYSNPNVSSAPPAQSSPRLWPLIDEAPDYAAKPLSQVLDHLDYVHGANSMRPFNYTVRSRLRHRQFRDLDVFADELRDSKARFPGGDWQLFKLYGLMSEPATGWWAPDPQWEAHLKIIEEWMSAFPDSITARVTYAHTLINYAWKVRGQGWAQDVKEEQWVLFNERNRKAKQVLQEAEALPSRCPQWYYLMQRIALAFSWVRDDYDKLFDEAVEFEPLYMAYYSAKANYLLPRWYGKEGEWEKFLVEATGRLEGEAGSAAFLYLFTGMEEYFEESELTPNVHRFWPLLQRGYQSTETLYRMSSALANGYARLAYIAGDRAEARVAFQRVGEDWKSDVWKNKEHFDQVKKWAFSSADSGSEIPIPAKDNP